MASPGPDRTGRPEPRAGVRARRLRSTRRTPRSPGPGGVTTIIRAPALPADPARCCRSAASWHRSGQDCPHGTAFDPRLMKQPGLSGMPGSRFTALREIPAGSPLNPGCGCLVGFRVPSTCSRAARPRAARPPALRGPPRRNREEPMKYRTIGADPDARRSRTTARRAASDVSPPGQNSAL
jgi:hypothetical protein